jgi:hypothetical protein
VTGKMMAEKKACLRAEWMDLKMADRMASYGAVSMVVSMVVSMADLKAVVKVGLMED